MSTCLAVAPIDAAAVPEDDPVTAPANRADGVELAGRSPRRSTSTAARPRAVKREPRLSKGERLVLGGGIAYSLGAAVHWATVGATGMLDGRRPGGTSGVTLGMNLGGLGMVQGVILAGIGGHHLARETQGRVHMARPMLAGGAVLTGLGAGAIVGSMLFMPTIRSRCPIDIGCVLVGTQLGGMALGAGVGMLAYGHRLRERDPNHISLSKDTKTPLIAGTVMFTSGYLMSAALGLTMWQEDPDDPVVRRTRNRLLIPVVGPWIHAAGPDAPLIMAMVTGGLGALQIAGAVGLAVGGGLAARERKRGRERRGWVRVVPRTDGLALVGQF